MGFYIYFYISRGQKTLVLFNFTPTSKCEFLAQKAQDLRKRARCGTAVIDVVYSRKARFGGSALQDME